MTAYGLKFRRAGTASLRLIINCKHNGMLRDKPARKLVGTPASGFRLRTVGMSSVRPRDAPMCMVAQRNDESLH